jgi:L-lactate dehydrogenase complex protein LldG
MIGMISEENRKVNQSCEGWREYFRSEKPDDDLYAEFETKARAVSTEIVAVATMEEAKPVISEIIRSVDAKKIVIAPDSMIEQTGIIDEINAMGVACYTSKEDIAAQRHDADIGISRVLFGVAEFGGVCQDAFSIESRLVSTLPPLHIVFLRRAHIVPAIEDALEIISRVFRKGYVSWITGPSRTADIERVLTIGVHGPSRFVIIVVSEDADEEAE